MKNRLWLLLIISAFCLIGCSPKHRSFQISTDYLNILQDTDPLRSPGFNPDTNASREAIEKFRKFYAVFSPENIRAGVRELYAPDAFFADGFKHVQGLDAIEAYFLRSVESVHSCRFEIADVVDSEGEYYFRWIMHLILERDLEKVIETVGMSHVRFNDRGQIVFHQDYWDTSLIYEQIPVLGRVIAWIKSRF
ncbi:MAG: nuclear transport factor 2 family protein [Thermodesulfobacteriota bacterium]